MRRLLIAWLMVSAVFMGTSMSADTARATDPAWAQAADHAKGRKFAVEGFKAYKQTDYATALEAFEQARTLYPAGQVLRMWGYTLLALERWVEAHAALGLALEAELKPLADSVRDEVRENLAKARSHFVVVTIKSETPDASVSIDGGAEERLPINERKLDEGAHRLVVTAEGYEEVNRSVDLDGGSSPVIDIELEPVTVAKAKEPEPEPFVLPSWTRPVAVGGIAAGLTALGAGVATLVAGRTLSGQVDDRNARLTQQWSSSCSSSGLQSCYDSAAANHRDAQRAYGLDTAGISLMVTGGVLAAAGTTTLILWSPKKPGSTETALRCLPTGLGGHCSLSF